MLTRGLAEALGAVGHDVVRVSELGMARADDAEILDSAIRGERVLVTLDRHFGDWAVLPLDRHPGVIRLRIHPATTSRARAILLPFLHTATDETLANHLIVLSATGVRRIRTG